MRISIRSSRLAGIPRLKPLHVQNKQKVVPAGPCKQGLRTRIRLGTLLQAVSRDEYAF